MSVEAKIAASALVRTMARIAQAASTVSRAIGSAPDVSMKICTALIAFTLLVSTPSQATVVVLNYTGAIDYSSSEGPTNAAYAIGTPFSGTITYDTDAIPSFKDGTVSTYYGSFGSLSLTIGSFSAIESSYLNGFIRHTPLSETSAPSDVLSISTPNPFVNGHNFPVQWGLDYYDLTRTSMSSSLLPAQYPASPPGFVRFYIGDYYGYSIGFANVTGAAVPEPATWAMIILGFGAIGAALRSRRNVKRVPALAQI